jgi:hypothetical protein
MATVNAHYRILFGSAYSYARTVQASKIKPRL